MSKQNKNSLEVILTWCDEQSPAVVLKCIESAVRGLNKIFDYLSDFKVFEKVGIYVVIPLAVAFLIPLISLHLCFGVVFFLMGKAKLLAVSRIHISEDRIGDIEELALLMPPDKASRFRHIQFAILWLQAVMKAMMGFLRRA